jgi:hypothetical protein
MPTNEGVWIDLLFGKRPNFLPVNYDSANQFKDGEGKVIGDEPYNTGKDPDQHLGGL